MGLLTTLAASAAGYLPRAAMGGPVIAKTARQENPAASGPATSISPTSRRAGEAQLLVLREVLASEARQYRNNRQSKAASDSEAELRELNHMILRAGKRKC
mgnify:CR=1 FL=1